MAATRPVILNGIYTIRAESSNAYLNLEADPNSAGTVQFRNNSASQQWNITSAGDGDYTLHSVAARKNLRLTGPGEKEDTWTLEPRGHEAYVIGVSGDIRALEFDGVGPVKVVNRNGGTLQRWVIEPVPVAPIQDIAGFPIGAYFEIKAPGTNNVLLTCRLSTDDGAQIQLWPRPTDKDKLRSAAFFIDRTGALVHAESGRNVDIVDNVLVIRSRRPVASPANLWSHAPPRFTFRNGQIQIAFNSNPAFASTVDNIYPNDSWRNKPFVLARDSAVRPSLALHPIGDFNGWIPKVPFTPFPHYDTTLNKDWAVVPEESGAVAEPRTLWEIVPLTV
ncbi:hypothetical protein H0H87_009433 [Tephrocybe sp. NHM501043]|nr:hypothetical protein H0H87_009433 [Tephrocybe sp. NHM501043]